MALNLQFQFGGHGNTQVIKQNVCQSLSALLVSVADTLKERQFASDEVRDHFFSRIDEITQFLNANHQDAFSMSKYMVFPFKAIAVDENLQLGGYVRSLLDALSVITFAEAAFEFLDNFVNIRIGGKNIFGIYYTNGGYDLRDAYSRLLKSMIDKKVTLPGSFVCIPLDTVGAYALEEDKINNIVTNIVGDSDYIRPLESGTPKCVSMTSYIIRDAGSVEEAQTHVREVLGLE